MHSLYLSFCLSQAEEYAEKYGAEVLLAIHSKTAKKKSLFFCTIWLENEIFHGHSYWKEDKVRLCSHVKQLGARYIFSIHIKF